MVKELLKNLNQPFSKKHIGGNSNSLPSNFEKNLYSGEFNGGYFFGGSLLMRPVYCNDIVADLDKWNHLRLWKYLYKNIEWNPSWIFFAEDIFGFQFVWIEDFIFHFDPETGDMEKIADSAEEWMRLMDSEPNFWTGKEILQTWNNSNPWLENGKKLIAKQPFVCGGEFSCDNLVSVGEIESMTIRASIADAIQNTPDGKKIRISLTD